MFHEIVSKCFTFIQVLKCRKLPKHYTNHNIDRFHYAVLWTGSASAVDKLCSADAFHSGNPTGGTRHWTIRFNLNSLWEILPSQSVKYFRLRQTNRHLNKHKTLWKCKVIWKLWIFQFSYAYSYVTNRKQFSSPFCLEKTKYFICFFKVLTNGI